MLFSREQQDAYALSANVLKRDSRKTDYIVLPLAAAVLAHLIGAMPEDEEAANTEQASYASASAMLALCSGEPGAWQQCPRDSSGPTTGK